MAFLGTLASLCLAVITLFVVFKYLYQLVFSATKLKRLKDPIRILTQTEKHFIAPYLQKYELALKDDDVYELKGDDLAVHTFTAQGNTTTRLLFAGIEVLIPYDLDNFFRASENTVEIAVAKAHTSKTSGVRIGVIVAINDIELTDRATGIWQEDNSNEDAIFSLNVISKRKESDLELYLRRNQLWYGGNITYSGLSLLSFLAALYLPQAVSWFCLIIAFLFILLSITSITKTYRSHQHKQDVLTARGKITSLPIKQLNKWHLNDIELYMTPEYHLRFPDEEQKRKFIYTCYDKDTEYLAAFTAHKSSGYQLLLLEPFQSILENYQKKTKVINLRTLLWIGGAGIALALTYPFFSQLDITPETIFQNTKSSSLEPVIYSKYEEIIDSPPNVGDRMILNSNGVLSCKIASRFRGNNAPDCNVVIMGKNDKEAEALPDYIQSMMALSIMPSNMGFMSGSEYGDDKIIMKPTYIQDIDKACAFNTAFDCNEIYQELASRFSTSGTHTNGANTEISSQSQIDNIKVSLSQPILRLDITTHSLLITSIRTWAEKSTAKYWQNYFSNQPESPRLARTDEVTIQLPRGYFYNFDENAVVPVTQSYEKDETKYWINAGNIASSMFDTKAEYSIEGSVVNLKRQGTAIAIKLSDSGANPYQQTIAFFMIVILSVSIMLLTIGQYVSQKSKIRLATKTINKSN